MHWTCETEHDGKFGFELKESAINEAVGMNFDPVPGSGWTKSLIRITLQHPEAPDVQLHWLY